MHEMRMRTPFSPSKFPTSKFIAEWKKLPDLYEKRDKCYTARKSRDRSMKRLSEVTGISEEVCRKKIKGLKDTMRQLCRKLPKTSDGFPDYTQLEQVTWPHFGDMLFMKDHIGFGFNTLLDVNDPAYTFHSIDSEYQDGCVVDSESLEGRVNGGIDNSPIPSSTDDSIANEQGDRVNNEYHEEEDEEEGVMIDNDTKLHLSYVTLGDGKQRKNGVSKRGIAPRNTVTRNDGNSEGKRGRSSSRSVVEECGVDGGGGGEVQFCMSVAADLALISDPLAKMRAKLKIQQVLYDIMASETSFSQNK